jgi:hypothetical protein
MSAVDLPPNSDLLPMQAASPPLFSAVPATSPANVGAPSLSMLQSGFSPFHDLTEAEI